MKTTQRIPTHRPVRDRSAFRVPRSEFAFTLVEILTVVLIITVLVGIGLTVGKGVVVTGMKARTNETIKNAELIATEYWALTRQHVNHLSVINQPFNWTMYSPKAFNDANTTAADTTTLAGSKPLPNTTGGDAYPGGDENSIGDIPLKSIDRFVWATISIRSLNSLYSVFDEHTLTDNDVLDTDTDNGMEPQGYLELRDAWGNKLIYAAYVRFDDDDNLPNSNADLRETYQADDFLPVGNTPFFASAGPDGLWGYDQATNPVKALSNTQINGIGRNTGESYNNAKLRFEAEAGDNIYSFGSLGTQ